MTDDFGQGDAEFGSSEGRIEGGRIQHTEVDYLAGRDVNEDQDAEEAAELEARRRENQDDMKIYQTLTPEEVFVKFDTDGSGYIDFDEYKAMLPQLGITISEAKAKKYFCLADTDGSGEIDFEEFKVAMFAVDPDTGNASGFAPNALLTPSDAFEMFDKDGTGQIDEDEFFFVLQYMNLKVSEKKQDELFAKYDTDESGYLEYEEFKQIWLRCANVRKELDDRNIQYPKFATRAALERLLEKVLNDEEDLEAKAIAEAKQFKQWQELVREKTHHLNNCRRRAKVELRTALDAAGQVYTFGRGQYSQFDEQVSKDIATSRSKLFGFEEVYDLWYGRLFPEDSFLVKIGVEERKKVAADPEYAEASLEIGKVIDIADPRTEVTTSLFKGVVCSTNTAALWGRRIVQVSVSDSVAFALSELGEIYAWGGDSHWWHDVEEDSLWQREWRGNVTPRSAALLGVGSIPEPEEEFVEPSEDPEDTRADKFKEILAYFGKWQPPPLPSERLKFYKDILFPKVNYDLLKTACEVRGLNSEGKTKLGLLDLLVDAIELEKRVLGERSHRRLRELEDEIIEFRKRKKTYLARKIVHDCQELWEPLLHLQAEQKAEEQAQERKREEQNHIQTEKHYAKWRARLHEARLDASGVYTPRGNSLELSISGFTARGASMKTPRGHEKGVYVSCGSNHAALVHQNGQLYSWGFGGSGRLGHDLSHSSNPRDSVPRPVLVEAFAGRPILRVSCGFNHSAALTVDGKLFVWGSATTGKLGLGTICGIEEAFCASPTQLSIAQDVRVRRVSCGGAHTACICDFGGLFIWGCGDGGRLGLGANNLGTCYTPTRVEMLSAFKIVGVSCGNAHTLVNTAVRERRQGEGSAQIVVQEGGLVFMAGPQSVLGEFCASFKLLKATELLPAAMVGAGYDHSAFITTEGQLYCWGNNFSGCCGLDPSIKFALEPVNIACIYQRPRNLALGKRSYQSSVYNGLGPYIGVDGNVNGEKAEYCLSSQCEAQPWFEVDLGEYCVIQTIKLWNRNDEPNDQAFDRDLFRDRLFPCFVLLSGDPFPSRPTDIEGGGGARTNLQLALDASLARIKLTKTKRCSTWHVPTNSVARYVRVQMEGLNFLHFAQLEVFGTPGVSKPVGRCSSVSLGRNVTIALVRPSADPKEVDKVYQRAVICNSNNADILRQYETFSLAYDKFGRGENIKKCLVCRGSVLCEICTLNMKFKEELAKMPLGVGGMRPTLEQVAQYLLNAPKPDLDYKPKARKVQTMIGRFTEDISDVFGATTQHSKKMKEDTPKSQTQKEVSEQLGDVSTKEESDSEAHNRNSFWSRLIRRR